MPAKKSAATSNSTGRSRVTAALRKATGVVAKATGRGAGTPASTTKKATAKTAAKKTTAKGPAKKAGAKAATAKKAPAKSTAKKAAAKKAPAKQAAKAAATKKTAAKKSAPAKTAAKRTTAKKTTAPKTPVAKKSPATKSTTTNRKKTAASAAPTKKAATNMTQKAAKTASKTAVTSRKLKVRDDESPWTAKELADVRAELEADVDRLTSELSGFEDDIAGLIKDSGDGAGDDQADTGAKTFEREHEYSLAQNSRDLLEQSVHALERIDDGTYGICENCGNAIGKLRLQAFPRATLCLTCKAQQERR